MKRYKINNQDFSIRFCHTFEKLGVTTILGAEKFLNNCRPDLRINDARCAFLRNEIVEFRKNH